LNRIRKGNAFNGLTNTTYSLFNFLELKADKLIVLVAVSVHVRQNFQSFLIPGRRGRPYEKIAIEAESRNYLSWSMSQRGLSGKKNIPKNRIIAGII
jgi:hypothetical protein